MNTAFRLARFVPSQEQRAPSPFLLDPTYWRNRLAGLDLDRSGLLVLEREDLSSPLCTVEELRVRTHDGIRLWGLRGSSPFHPNARRARVHLVGAFERPVVSLDAVTEGCADFVFQVPAGRRLEDRVLDVLRLCQLIASNSELELEDIELAAPTDGPMPDEFMIARRLIENVLT